MIKTRLHTSEKFPVLNKKGSAPSRIAIYDRCLKKKIPGFTNWLLQFDLAIPVTAGESLKTLSMVDVVGRRVLKGTTSWPRMSTEIWAVGGGSVGDFVGFFASIFQRGVKLVHVPTTWLAAIDSAHGGKTALNLAGIKNQVGTFYSATDTWLILPFLKNQNGHADGRRLQESFGEAAKMALLDLEIWKKSNQSPMNERTLWKLLPALIQSKLRVVARDPFEKKGLRIFLNLGHTLGHVLESRLNIAHGDAVRLGIFFSIWLSQEKKIMKREIADTLFRELETRWGFDHRAIYEYKSLSSSQIRQGLLRDKKMHLVSKLSFVALKGPGKPTSIRISVNELTRLIQTYWKLA